MPGVTDLQRAREGLDEVLERWQCTAEPIHVLEAGGGSTSHLRLTRRATVTVVDISQEQLDKNSVADVKILADLHAVRLEPETYDLVVCWDVLEHLHTPTRVIRILTDALKVGGLLVLAAPNPHSAIGLITKFTPHWFHVFVLRDLMKSPNAGKPGFGPFPTYMRFSAAPATVRRTLEGASCRVRYYSVYQSTRRAVLRRTRPAIGWIFDRLIGALGAVSLGRWQPEASDWFIVAEKIGGQGPS